MDQEIELETLRNRVREMVWARLVRLARQKEPAISQSFLFRKNQLAGVRFRSGLFHADWFYDSRIIQFFWGDQCIDQLTVAPGNDRRAA